MHGREVTLEFEDVKMIPDTELPYYWNVHYHSLLNFLTNVNYGIRGKVTNALSQTPVKASISIIGYDYSQSEIFSDSITGMYFRLLLPGTYAISVSAPGYQTKTVEGIELAANSQVRMDVQLNPGQTPVPTDSFENRVNIYPNPSTSFLMIHLPYGNNESVSVYISDIFGKIVYSNLYNWYGEDLNVPVQNLTNGVYLMHLKSSRMNNTFKFIKN